jgi:hypothetical protein
MKLEKIKRELRKDWTLWGALGCTLLAFAWLGLVGWYNTNIHSCALPALSLGPGTINYSELLANWTLDKPDKRDEFENEVKLFQS